MVNAAAAAAAAVSRWHWCSSTHDVRRCQRLSRRIDGISSDDELNAHMVRIVGENRFIGSVDLSLIECCIDS